MTETQKRIKAYQKALPFMKERVMAVALLFVMSISMMASATFAWVTLSRSPQISGLSTTVATNGNLEIALSDEDGNEPDPTSVTDGSGDITESNLKWGNLINLSHGSYGLSSLTLRPASLNQGSLLTEPLYSVEYAYDGRISNVIYDFAYTNYESRDGANAFFVPDQVKYGVRAISSVTYDSVTGNATLQTLNNNVKQKYAEAYSTFEALWSNSSYMNSITGLAGVYLSWRSSDDGNGGNVDQDCSSYVEIINDMYSEFRNSILVTGEVFVASANVYNFINNQQNFIPFTSDDLYDGTIKTTLAAQGVTLDGLDSFIKDHNLFIGTKANNYEDGLYEKYKKNVYEPYKQNQSIGWVLMSSYINPVADVNTATIDGKAANVLGAGDLVSIAFGKPVCELQKGILWNMDWYFGGEISVANVKAVAMGFTVNIKEIRTSVKGKVEDPSNKTYTNYPIIETKNKAIARANQGGLTATDAIAADTYGMVVDFWLRTNAADALLSLAGKVNTAQEQLYDTEGNPVYDDNGNPVFETVVLGYSGENRIWEEDDELSALGPSTSQGSGSCYIFYPETPEDQAQALEMLAAMRVAFIDEEGNLLAQADMDTTMAFEQEGRVLVPLQLRAKSIITGTDEEGNPITENAYYITKLVQNEATRITAIVYLDGSRLENSNVLAAGSIKGQLNIQFDSSEDLDAKDDQDLMDEFYDISIEAIGETEFDKFDPDNKPQVKLSLAVVGMNPDNIKGQFVSYISETQGASQPEFDFEKTDNGWEATVTFEGSGSFKLRNIRIDGVDYALKEDQIITVEIAGVTVNSIFCEGWDNKNTKTVMTADSYYQLNSSIGLNISAGQNPKKVQAVFAHNEGQSITVDYNKTENGWTASAMFTTSGTYELTYVIIDGVYTPLPEELHKKITLYLGLKAQVFLSQPMTEEYQSKLAEIEDAEAAEIAAYRAANAGATSEELSAGIAAIQKKYNLQKDSLYDEAYGEDGLKMTTSASGYSLIYDGSESLYMNVSCIIRDDKGNAITGLKDVVLYYSGGSMNVIDTNLTWNSSSGRYEGPDASETESTGRFKISLPSIYSFQSVVIGKGEEKNTISVATDAPTIRALSPTPISYIGKATESYVGEEDKYLYKESVVDISTSANRYMSVLLKDAISAEVQLKIQNIDEGAQGEVSDWLDAEKIDLGTESRYLYNVKAPTDGVWKIVGIRIKSVYYNDVLYDGEEGSTGWLDWTDKVVASNIVTKFFTTINVSATENPSNITYTTGFMEGKKFDDISLIITDYLGRPVEGIKVGLKYEWQGYRTAGITDNSSVLPASYKVFGSDDVASSDGKTFSIGAVHFQLDGTYKCTFKIIYDGVEYSNLAKGGFDANNVTIEWEQLDVITISAITPNGKNFAIDDIASGTTTDSSRTEGCDTIYTTAAAHKNANSHNYTAEITNNGKTASVYIVCEDYSSAGDDHECAPAEVTLTMTAIENVTAATLNFVKQGGGTVHLYTSYSTSLTNWDADTEGQTSSYTWSSGSGTCMRYVGKVGGSSSNSDSKTAAGILESQSITLTYNGIQFTLPYTGITIKNER